MFNNENFTVATLIEELKKLPQDLNVTLPALTKIEDMPVDENDTSKNNPETKNDTITCNAVQVLAPINSCTLIVKDNVVCLNYNIDEYIEMLIDSYKQNSDNIEDN